jgi:hypothetical protein
MKKRLYICLFIAFAMTVFGFSPVQAKEYMLGGKPLTLTGYVTQGGAYGLHNDYDTKEGVQSLLMNAFVEGQYRPNSQLSLYSSLRFTGDWAYDVNNGSDWSNKLFPQSRSRMYVDNNYWQVLNEVHATWKPDNFMFRVGKQIVSWGEMDSFRIMDQINPLDSRRGFADVEFENTIIPIWLIRSEFYPRLNIGWLQDLGLEFTFNPNADFISDQNPLFGNDDGGIWAPNVRFPTAGVPFDEVRLGSAYYNNSKPARWSSEGFEYAFRAKGVVADTILTLNYFYGVDNSPVFKFQPVAPGVTTASDGRLLLHNLIDTDYKRLHFAGLTASRDIPSLAFSALGGVAPVVRFEGLYAFGTTFETNDPVQDDWTRSDEVRAGLGVDWKIKVPFLNPKANISISPQVYYRKVMDAPSTGVYWTDAQQNYIETDNYQTSLFLSTPYLNAKLTPSVFWLHDFVWDSNFYRLQLTYDWSSSWRATVGAIFLDGNKQNYGFEPFANKDYVFCKLSYKF